MAVNDIIYDESGAIFNVRNTEYATPAPTTNWAPAIQEALDAAGNVGGGIVYVPHGTYPTTETLSVPANVTLQGSGWGTVIDFEPTETELSAVLLDGVTGAAVRALKIINNGAKAVDRVNTTLTYAGGACVEVRDSDLCVVDGVYAEWGSSGVWLNNTTDAPSGENWTTNRNHLVQNCVGREQAGYAFYVLRGDACALLGNDAKGCGYDGFKTIRRSRLLRIEGNQSEGNGRDGYDFFDGLLESTVVGNTARDNSLFGFDVKGTLGGDEIGNDDYVVRDCTFSGNLATGNEEGGYSIISVRNSTFGSSSAIANPKSGFILTNVQGVTLSGCLASKNAEHGFLVQSSSRATLVGCVAADNSYDDGTTQNASFDGFNVDAGSTVQIVGGRSFNGTTTGHKGGQRYGLNLGSGTMLVEGVDATGNVTAGINGYAGNLVSQHRTHAGTLVGGESDSDSVALVPRQKVKSKTLTANSATPSVSDANKGVTANTSATTITNFSSGVDEQVLYFRAGDANTTLQHGTNIFLKGGANKTFALNETALFVREGGVWREY